MRAETYLYWRRIAVAIVIASAVVLFVFNGASWDTPPAQLVRGYLISLLFSACIAPMLGAAMPRIAPIVWRHLGFPWNWFAITTVMTTLAMIGSLVAIGVLVAFGVVPAPQFWNWFRGSVRIAIAITLTIGIFITALETTRARTAQAATAAQLASLESRVQPHFLFNTLNSISELIRQDPIAAEQMVGQLASLLRSSLDQQAMPLVSLDDELQSVRDYLSIEQVRFGDRLKFVIHNEAGPGARVPRLALQTLVENSVKFAVAPRREGGSITIGAVGGQASRANLTTITVEDDGPGFDATTLPDGHGLALLRDRLALLFGGRVRLQIDSAPGRTAVSFTVPETHDRPRSNC